MKICLVSAVKRFYKIEYIFNCSLVFVVFDSALSAFVSFSAFSWGRRFLFLLGDIDQIKHTIIIVIDYVLKISDNTVSSYIALQVVSANFAEMVFVCCKIIFVVQNNPVLFIQGNFPFASNGIYGNEIVFEIEI